MEFFAIICIGTIAIHLVINIILRKYGNGDNIENFSIKLDSFKNSDKTKNIKFLNKNDNYTSRLYFNMSFLGMI
jgi:hypothetical protein